MTTTSPEPAGAAALVTVVLPAFNHGRYVVEAMDSVRAQTFTRWELIVIDDGSTDDTLAVLQAYVAQSADPRIRLLTQANAGSHATLNRGLEMARTPYLAILNSDDRFAPNRLQHLMDVARTAGEEAFIVTGVRLIDGDGVALPSTHWWNTMYGEILRRWRSVSQAGQGAVQTLLWGNFTVSTSNFFMTRSLWLRVGPFRHRRYVPDWDYALRVAVERPKAFHFLDGEVLLDYRLHGRNTILGGALRNHVEAAYVLRRAQKAMSALKVSLVPHAIDRVKYLDRFLRQEKARFFMAENSRLTQELQAQQLENARLEEALLTQRVESDRLTQELKARDTAMNALLASTSWQVTRPLRGLSMQLRRVRRGFSQRLRAWTVAQSRMLPLPGGARAESQNSLCTLDYARWMHAEKAQIDQLRRSASDWLAGLQDRPLVSIVVGAPASPTMLRALLESVLVQIYPHWELCVDSDPAMPAAVCEMLQAYQARDQRIQTLNGHGSCVSSVQGTAVHVRGDCVVFAGADGVLAPHALMRMVQVLQERTAVDALYSDEDKIDAAGARCLPLFKPDWSPVLAWSQNYAGSLLCVRGATLNRIGGLRDGLQGSQLYDLVLRLAADGARFHHLACVLYHGRLTTAMTTQNSEEATQQAVQTSRKVVKEHLQHRYGNQFERLEDGGDPRVFLPRFRLDHQPVVSIIIPTKDRIDLLGPCIDSIQRLSTYSHFEIIVIDNNSTEPATAAYLKALVQREANVRVIEAHIEFNWSRLNNLGVKQAQGEYLVFLNNDTLVITPDWLERLIEVASLPDVATVGPLLLFEDGTVQHAGVVVGMGGWADHVYRGALPDSEGSPFIASTVARNVLANTGACVAIERKKFDALGGFDEAFQICGSDVELGLRAHHRGLQNVYWPQVRLHHLESKTRSPHVPECDFVQSRLKYAPFRDDGDPFYNINLDRMSLLPVPLFPSSHGPVQHD